MREKWGSERLYSFLVVCTAISHFRPWSPKGLKRKLISHCQVYICNHFSFFYEYARMTLSQPPVAPEVLPQARDLAHHLSEESRLRQNLRLKLAFKYFSDPSVVFLGGGLPLSDYFPVESISAKVPTPPFANGIGAPLTEETTTLVEVFKNPQLNDPAIDEVNLARALQYGYTEGQPELLLFLREHTQLIHRPPYRDWGVMTSVGNTQLWDATLRTFANRGDAILVEEYLFSSALEAVRAQGIHTIPMQLDEYGIVPEALEHQLERWVGPKPRLLYTIATGQNPTGSSLTAERRRKIYALACKHDLILVEDEPYYFLQMETYTSDVTQRSHAVSSYDDFVAALVPSFLSMDVEGRVIRLDSFSKVLAPGVRIGWIVGQKRLLERFLRIHEVSIQTPAGLLQAVVNGILQRWGQNGYLDWLMGLRAEYTHKRDVAIDSVAEHFPKEVVSYTPPVAGMFFTVNLDASKHPKFHTEFGGDVSKVEEAVFDRSIAEGCLIIPGSWFRAEGQTEPPQPKVPVSETAKNNIFFRGTYAAVPLEKLQRGLKHFGRAVKLEFGIET